MRRKRAKNAKKRHGCAPVLHGGATVAHTVILAVFDLFGGVTPLLTGDQNGGYIRPESGVEVAVARQWVAQYSRPWPQSTCPPRMVMVPKEPL